MKLISGGGPHDPTLRYSPLLLSDLLVVSHGFLCGTTVFAVWSMTLRDLLVMAQLLGSPNREDVTKIPRPQHVHSRSTSNPSPTKKTNNQAKGREGQKEGSTTPSERFCSLTTVGLLRYPRMEYLNGGRANGGLESFEFYDPWFTLETGTNPKKNEEKREVGEVGVWCGMVLGDGDRCKQTK